MQGSRNEDGEREEMGDQIGDLLATYLYSEYPDILIELASLGCGKYEAGTNQYALLSLGLNELLS